MWWFLRGFQVYDKHHEVQDDADGGEEPAAAAARRRACSRRTREDRNQDMVDMRADEDKSLDHAGWVDQQGGTLRVPVDVAIDAIAQRGVAPFPATGAAAACRPSRCPRPR